MRELLTTFVNALVSADADTDAVCDAAYGTRGEEQVSSRNGYRRRDLDTRVGTLDVAIPKLDPETGGRPDHPCSCRHAPTPHTHPRASII
jgi:hypothetical protein